MSKNDYSFSDRLLHSLVLGTPLIGRISLELEQIFTNNDDSIHNIKPVFINGLARAGTTILMRAFYGTGLFRSLTYRDLPFILMPGVWKRFSTFFSKEITSQERAHGDGIMVSFDSPEAFEEIFWKTFCADSYIFNDHLEPHVVSQEVINLFQIFVKHVINSADKTDQQRYLSKNNNNILRPEALKKAFPDAIIIIPFRDPIQQSISLHHQHQKFSALQLKDPFIYKYMNWLGHCEFGAGHKAVHFSKAVLENKIDYEPDNINYWLTVWINTYCHILNSTPSETLYVSFDKLCRSPKDITTSLFSMAGISHEKYLLKEKIKAPEDKSVDNIDELLMKKSVNVHNALLARVNPRTL
jgi:hypothetical protein